MHNYQVSEGGRGAAAHWDALDLFVDFRTYFEEDIANVEVNESAELELIRSIKIA